MTVLLGSADHVRKANRWGLLVHTAALFSFSTMSLAIGLFFLSAAYIDAREFSGVDDLPSGPYGYLGLPKFVVFAGISDSVTPVNQWLIDGLLASPMLNSVTWVLNLSCFYSCIVATSFTT